MTRVLLPASNHSQWAESVADVVVDTEDDDDLTAVVAHVFDDDEVESTNENLDIEGRAKVDELASRKSGVNAATQRLEDAGIDTEVRGVEHEGEPAEAIVAAVDEEDADRLYMYSRKRSPAGKAVFGSTLQEAILKARVPIVVVPSNAL
ncbi:universal stress protein [Halobaculum magnesiiphilum]|uniref:universal stress protein n=1 Tax=Halobaculum magnesiiphilum TaxID=1017351 RepID=UPI001CED3375|nr:universal stress protein [Halobaculum magnesiiphilum]